MISKGIELAVIILIIYVCGFLHGYGFGISRKKGEDDG